MKIMEQKYFFNITKSALCEVLTVKNQTCIESREANLKSDDSSCLHIN